MHIPQFLEHFSFSFFYINIYTVYLYHVLLLIINLEFV